MRSALFCDHSVHSFSCPSIHPSTHINQNYRYEHEDLALLIQSSDKLLKCCYSLIKAKYHIETPTHASTHVYRVEKLLAGNNSKTIRFFRGFQLINYWGRLAVTRRGRRIHDEWGHIMDEVSYLKSFSDVSRYLLAMMARFFLMWTWIFNTEISLHQYCCLVP